MNWFMFVSIYLSIGAILAALAAARTSLAPNPLNLPENKELAEETLQPAINGLIEGLIGCQLLSIEQREEARKKLKSLVLKAIYACATIAIALRLMLGWLYYAIAGKIILKVVNEFPFLLVTTRNEHD